MVVPRLVFARRHAFPRVVEAIMPASVIIGSFLLNRVLLFGGQLTGPVGL